MYVVHCMLEAKTKGLNLESPKPRSMKQPRMLFWITSRSLLL
jgi:hypothetical protein